MPRRETAALPQASPPAGSDRATTAPASRPGLLQWPGPPRRFIGRAHDCATLATLLGQHQIVLVTGPPGIGKTALVREVVDAASTAGRLPPPASTSLADAEDSREILDRTVQALGQLRLRVDPAQATNALQRICDAAPCTLVWEDLDVAPPEPVAELLVGLNIKDNGRLVLVSREPGPHLAHLPVFEVGPLTDTESRRLLARVEADRGGSLEEGLLASAGGNPLLLSLAFARVTSAPEASDPTAALRQTVTSVASGSPGRLLELLLAASVPLDVHELRVTWGPDAEDAMESLRRSLVVTTHGSRVSLPPAVVAVVRSVLGPPSRETWQVLAELGSRRLAADPADTEALLLACRAHSSLGDVPRALQLLHEHLQARAATPLAPLSRALRAMALADPDRAVESLLLLAREQLRWGDFDAALRTLDGIPRDRLQGRLRHRARILRAEALVRSGDLTRAQEELERADRSRDGQHPHVAIASAEVTLARGNLAASRRQLWTLAAATTGLPYLEGRRLAALALGYFVEDRYDRSLVLARRARAAYQRQGAYPVETLVTALEIFSLLGLEQIDRATALLEQAYPTDSGVDEEVLGRGLGAAVCAAVRWRRGDHTACLATMEPSLEALRGWGDQGSRIVMARYLAWAASELGLLGRAEEILRSGVAIARETGMVAFRPLVESELASLARARGDLAEARRWIARALEVRPASPYIRIEAWALGLTEGATPPVAGTPKAVRAYAQLRAAEEALATGRPTEAVEPARTAEKWYAKAGAAHEVTRAQVTAAEALVREGDFAASRRLLDRCEAAAMAGGYRPIVVTASLVRAALGDRSGDLGAYVGGLGAACAAAGEELRDDALTRACTRVGLEARPVTKSGAPWAALVARLGLDRPRSRLSTQGSTARLLAEGELEQPCADLVLDLADGCVRAGDREAALPRQRLILLQQLLAAGPRGATLEELYLKLWGGTVYHPLRNRNAIYVALTRLRSSVEPVAGRQLVLTSRDKRYRLPPDLTVIILEPADDDLLRGRHDRARKWPAGEPRTPEAWARHFQLPPGQATWEVALLEEERR